MEKAYEPARHEGKIYEQWEQSGAFKPQGSGAPFTIIMPPPNANGVMHLGHAMYVLEDIMIRFRRMQGRATLWLPGTDHAGIETQFVFERDVLGPKGQDRFALGQEKFYQEIWEYSRSSEAGFLQKFKAMGFSADWSRLQFTLDESIIATVYDTFKRMHDDGLVYRGNRIVNWCPTCQAAFADIEIDHQDRADHLYTLDYGSIQIATTRPETIFADVAVAVNPNDKRFAVLVGQTATIPLVDRPVAIIADEHVDPKFGTGALKITPAHDKNDFEIGERHNLPQIEVVDKEGRLINVPEEFAGLTVAEGRTAVVKALTQAKKLVTMTPLNHAVGVHDRCGTVIEPLITEQWYLHVGQLNQPVIKAIEADEIKFVPARFKKLALDWLRQEHDWNISRQIWWGIRIPVYYKTSNDPAKDAYLVAADEAEAQTYYGAGNYRAETDTFDTWFSSGQWPFATLQASGDLNRFYPTQDMMSARDILTKWITKMVMFGLYRTDNLPFRTVYLWGMVTDDQGRKMSKSKGNGIDPLEMTAKFGTDALRLALTIGITPGNDGSLSEAKIEGYRNFCNKLWNVARFILGTLPDNYSPTPPEPKSPADDWILAKVDAAVAATTKAIEGYRFSEAGQLVYSLLWDDLADWYVEAAKVEPNPDVLVYALETVLTLAHPFAPFVTEAIWQSLPWQSGQLITHSWPAVNKGRTSGAIFESAREVIMAVRTIRAEERLGLVKLATKSPTLLEQAAVIQKLGGVGEIVPPTDESTDGGLVLPTRELAVLLVGHEVVQSRRQRLTKIMAEKEGYLKQLEAKLANPQYVASAPQPVQQQTKELRDEAAELINKLREQLRVLES